MSHEPRSYAIVITDLVLYREGGYSSWAVAATVGRSIVLGAFRGNRLRIERTETAEARAGFGCALADIGDAPAIAA